MACFGSGTSDAGFSCRRTGLVISPLHDGQLHFSGASSWTENLGEVDSEFNELTEPDVPLDNIGRDVEVAGVLGVHDNAAHQLVAVGELL
ncbi:MAG: hypothetical protein R3C12_07690 [Planctomycetaceae bacterium]